MVLAGKVKRSGFPRAFAGIYYHDACISTQRKISRRRL